MMQLVAVQTIQIPAEQQTELGAVPMIGVPAMLTITRGWFQCPACSVIGAFDELVSPLMPPGCPQGCDAGTEQ